MNSTIKNIGRWVLVLPLSFIALPLVDFLLSIFYTLVNWVGYIFNNDKDYITRESYIYQCLLGVVHVWVFTHLGAFIAPKHRRIVFHILLVFFFIFAIATAIMFFPNIKNELYNIKLKNIDKNQGLVWVARAITTIITVVYLYFKNPFDEDD